MSDALATCYDELPYESNPIFTSHPDWLATVATLFGLAPPAVAECRVLELGCGMGGNVIPMAFGLPEARCVGIDLSGRQIEMGREFANALQLDNLELEKMSILDVDRGFGEFDYVVCHGVLSWTPRPVQDKILDICATNLSENGVAYVSYNTYPGWRLRQIVRDAMRFGGQSAESPAERVKRGRAFLDFLVNSLPDPESSYAQFLREDVEHARHRSDSHLFHDLMEDDNEPLYFQEFAERLALAGLVYVGDAEVDPFVAGRFSPELCQTLQKLAGDYVAMEQCADFLRRRMFRRSLVCRGGQKPARTVAPERLMGLRMASPVEPVDGPADVASSEPQRFRGPTGAVGATDSPLVKAALFHLGKTWPAAAPFDALFEAVRERLAGTEAAVRDESDARPSLAAAMLSCYLNNAMELHSHVSPYAADVSERPEASRLARLQAEQGTRAVTNLRHRPVALSDVDRRLLCKADGSHNRDGLCDALLEVAEKEDVRLGDGERLAADAEEVTRAVDRGLETLKSGVLLVG